MSTEDDGKIELSFLKQFLSIAIYKAYDSGTAYKIIKKLFIYREYLSIMDILKWPYFVFILLFISILRCGYFCCLILTSPTQNFDPHPRHFLSDPYSFLNSRTHTTAVASYTQTRRRAISSSDECLRTSQEDCANS